MIDLFSDENRRDPFALYDRLRVESPLFLDGRSGVRMVFDYEGVKRVLTDHASFSSRIGPAEWVIFVDPPRHTQLRALIAKAFTPKSVANLEGRIGEIVNELLDAVMQRGNHGEMDVAAEFATPLPMRVIADMLGVSPGDCGKFVRWNDAILAMSFTVLGHQASGAAVENFIAATAEMNEYVGAVLEERRASPRDDLLTRLMQAELDGEKLSQRDILNFFQALLVAGTETTTNLINNAILCFTENPAQLALLRNESRLLGKAIEEVLRYRSPLQWMFRVTTRAVELHGERIPPGVVILAMIGAANRDPGVFVSPERFEIEREPNAHLAFGHGIHFCMGAPLARLEARVGIGEMLSRFRSFERADVQPWAPRAGLHVHGPVALPIRFTVS